MILSTKSVKHILDNLQFLIRKDYIWIIYPGVSKKKKKKRLHLFAHD